MAEGSNSPTVKRITQPDSASLLGGEPRLELRRIGDDVTEHEGLEWIYLRCPHCGVHSRFTPETTVIVEQPDDGSGHIIKDYHTLAQCEYCGDIIYVKCFEDDYDPDWWFGYEHHHPSIAEARPPSGLPQGVYSAFYEARTCFRAGAYLAAGVMCKRTIQALLYERGVEKELPLTKGLQKAVAGITSQESPITDLGRFLDSIGDPDDKDQGLDKDRAAEIVKMTEQLLDTIYIAPNRVRSTEAEVEEGHIDDAPF